MYSRIIFAPVAAARVRNQVLQIFICSRSDSNCGLDDKGKALLSLLFIHEFLRHLNLIIFIKLVQVIKAADYFLQ